ncbi:hypothetical protein H5410_057551 [Solanum commersonii]|uniref:Uncharacterized protein n=1 Tax=Solanum commersonii TaxID=4109 RepID=A0A9J5WNE1_SOLCO|nr:hypothetical protein H5410_057551 [Solanum commersonii]
MLSIILHKSCLAAREPHGLCITRSPPATKWEATQNPLLLYCYFRNNGVLNEHVKVWRVCGNCIWRTNSSIQRIAEQVGHPDENLHFLLFYQGPVKLGEPTLVLNVKNLLNDKAGDTTLKSQYRQMAKFVKSKRNLSISGACFDFALNSRRWIENGHVGPFGELGRARRIVRRFAHCLHIALISVLNWMFEFVTFDEKTWVAERTRRLPVFLFDFSPNSSQSFVGMTKPNKEGSNTPFRGKEKGITINEDATASRTKATKLSTTCGKAETNIDRKIRANLWVKACIVFIFVRVSVASDFKALNCEPSCDYGIILSAEKNEENEGLRIAESTWQVAEKSHFAFCSNVLSPEGKDQVGGKRDTISPNGPEHDDAEGWCKTAMN